MANISIHYDCGGKEPKVRKKIFRGFVVIDFKAEDEISFYFRNKKDAEDFLKQLNEKEWEKSRRVEKNG